MLEDPPYNLIVAVTAYDPKDWCAELPLPSHLLCFERIKNADIMFNQFIHRLQASGINVKTDKAFRAQPHEVIRVFNQVRDEAFNSQQVTKEPNDEENRNQLHELNKDGILVFKEAAHQVFTAEASVSTLLLATQQRVGKLTLQDGIAEDTETGLMWLRFAYGQTWYNKKAIGDVKKVNWNEAFEMVKQFNQQGGHTGKNDWRLPTIDELKSLIEHVKDKSGNTIDTDIFPENSQRFWSSSPLAYGRYKAWSVTFVSGTENIENKNQSNAIRFVRGNTIDKTAGNQMHSVEKAP